MTERIALYGGTFDPFHRGHVDPVSSVRDAMGWSQVIYLPAFAQPFKANRQASSPFHRYAMAVLGTEDHEWARVSTWELERDEISYTVETLRHFAGALPGHSFDWIIGDDNIETLSKWRAIDEIFAMANFVVLRRGGSDRIEPALSLRIRPAPDRGRAGAIVFADNDPVVVSSTEIRERFRNGQDATGLVPPRVDRYIRRHRLYVSQED